MATRRQISVMVMGLVMLYGCRSASRMRPIVEGNQIDARLEDGLGFFEAAKDVLRDSGFDLDRTDERFGIITTNPSVGPHFFEFWRGDYSTHRDIWESSLNPIRRSIRVSITPATGVSITPGDASSEVSGSEVSGSEVSGFEVSGETSLTGDAPGGVVLKVTVLKQRLSHPDRQFNNSAAVFSFFNPSVVLASSGSGSGGGLPEWIDMGEDTVFANVMLNRILLEARRRNSGITAP